MLAHLCCLLSRLLPLLPPHVCAAPSPALVPSLAAPTQFFSLQTGSLLCAPGASLQGEALAEQGLRCGGVMHLAACGRHPHFPGAGAAQSGMQAQAGMQAPYCIGRPPWDGTSCALLVGRHCQLHQGCAAASNGPASHFCCPPQGWRLDPLLLFGQLMTTGAAVSFAVEALRLRNEVYEGEVRGPAWGSHCHCLATMRAQAGGPRAYTHAAQLLACAFCAAGRKKAFLCAALPTPPSLALYLQEKAALQDVLRRNGGPDGGSTGGSFQLPPPEAAQQPWTASSPDQQQQPWADQQAWVPSGTQQPQQGGAYGYSPYDSMQQQQQPAAWGDAAPQQWDYQSGGPIQPAEYEPYSDAGAAGADFFSIGSSGTGGAAPPSEFTFPASYEDGGAAAQQEGSSTWGGSGQQQQGQQQRGQGGNTQQRGGSNFDGMDDW